MYKKYCSFTRNIIKYYVTSGMSDSRNKTDSGQDCQGTWIIHLNSEQIHKAILRGLIILVESIWSAAFGIWVGGVFLFVFMVGFIWNSLFWGKGSKDLWMFQFAMDVLKQNLCSDHSWSLFSFRVIHFSVKGWLFSCL